MWTKVFWLQTAERAVKSFAQSMLLALGAGGGFNLFELSWYRCLGFGLGGMLLSVLTSLASLPLPIGQPNSPSLVRTQ
jgi:hypothetical protein